MSEEMDKILCPFCGVDQQLDFLYTNLEFHDIECCNCNMSFTYKITKYDWEVYHYDDLKEGDPCYGDSVNNPPPEYLDEYAIPSFKCLIEHWTILKNWKYMSLTEKIDWFILRLPVKIKKWYFENTLEWER